jgi:hypothetical protein
MTVLNEGLSKMSQFRISSRTLDMIFGALVMGTVGTLIGLILGRQAHLAGAVAGIVMGAMVGLFGGRRFLISILTGTILGGALAWGVAGAEKITVGAGAGAAMGGFVGVQLSMLLDLRSERRRVTAERQKESGKTEVYGK